MSATSMRVPSYGVDSNRRGGVSSPEVQGARFKGKLGMSVRRAIKTALGDRSIESVIDALPADARWMLTERFIATQWYPLRSAGVMMEGVARAIGRAPLDVAQQLGRDVAVGTAGRAGRTLLNLFGTPQRLARYLGPMWDQLYDSGRIQADYDEATGVLTVRRMSWLGHDPLLCITLLGSIETLSLHMGRPRLLSAARTTCVSEGAPGCQFELRFDRP